jgi:hypothetical protein
VRIFKNDWFSRFAEREGISDGELKAAVNRLETGQADAGLGGGVYKQRVARPRAGKSGGYRVIVFFRSGERTFFVYGFAKSYTANISRQELQVFKHGAKTDLKLTDKQIEARLKNGTLQEIGGS